MKTLILVTCLLCFGTLANAANMFVDFTKTPTAFNFDANWDTSSSTATTFTGTFLANSTATGSDLVAIVNMNDPTELLDTLSLTFSTSASGGATGEETFGGSVMTGINGGSPIPAGAIVEDATGSSVDITAALSGHGPFPSNITLQVQAESPTPTPEPASLVLFGTAMLAIAGIWAAKRRRLHEAA